VIDLKETKKRQPKPEKIQVVTDFTARLKNCKAAVVTVNEGLTVEEVTQLRSLLFKEKVELHVVKNTLAKIALKQAEIAVLDDFLSGPTAIALAMGDSVAPARVLAKFAKEHEKLKLRGGWVDGQKVSDKDLKALANLPSRLQLLAKVLGSMKSPLTGLVMVLSGTERKLLYALNAVKDQKAKTA
jgi:large subunit ribosomal protein L10